MLRTGNLSKSIDDQHQAAKYQDWWEDMQDFAAKHNNISGLTQLVSMWNPVIGFGLDTINRTYQKYNMPDEFESSYLYTSMDKDREYHEGSQDSLLELEAGMWSSLMGHFGRSAQLHGIGGFKEAFGDIGKFGKGIMDFFPEGPDHEDNIRPDPWKPPQWWDPFDGEDHDEDEWSPWK